MKVCSVCGDAKPLADFPRNGRFADGMERRRADCYVCYNICRKAKSKKSKASFRRFVGSVKVRTGEKAEITLEDWKQCLVFFRGSCAYCGRAASRSVKLSKDHVVAMVQGGLTTKYNIVPACISCNSSKQGDNLEKWYYGQRCFSDERLCRIYEWHRRR